MHQKLSKSVDV